MLMGEELSEDHGLIESLSLNEPVNILLWKKKPKSSNIDKRIN